jgi:hypothetical protein
MSAKSLSSQTRQLRGVAAKEEADTALVGVREDTSARELRA